MGRMGIGEGKSVIVFPSHFGGMCTQEVRNRTLTNLTNWVSVTKRHLMITVVKNYLQITNVEKLITKTTLQITNYEKNVTKK